MPGTASEFVQRIDNDIDNDKETPMTEPASSDVPDDEVFVPATPGAEALASTEDDEDSDDDAQDVSSS